MFFKETWVKDFLLDLPSNLTNSLFVSIEGFFVYHETFETSLFPCDFSCTQTHAYLHSLDLHIDPNILLRIEYFFLYQGTFKPSNLFPRDFAYQIWVDDLHLTMPLLTIELNGPPLIQFL